MNSSLLLIFLFHLIDGYKIIYLMPIATSSHRQVFNPLILELASRNHEITIVGPYSFSEPQKNVREILIDKRMIDPQVISKGFFDNAGISYIMGFILLKYAIEPSCDSYLKNPEVQELLKKGKQFDLVIVSNIYNECALATAPLLGDNIIIQSSSSLNPMTSSSIPQPPSFVSLNVIPLGSKLNFFQRLENAISWFALKVNFEYNYKPYIQSTIAKYLPENPLISDAEKKVTVILTNADPVLTSPRPSIPGIQNVGGMQCKKAKPVPKEFEEFIQTSGENGFIMFSLGSIAQSKHFPKEKVKDLLDTFSRLKQNVIWKYEEKLEDLPKNVMITKWLPQQDLLGHPKIKLFISHGGMLSLQESIYNAVPLVAIPLFAEQPGNAARVEEIGIGLKLSFLNITGVSMYESINRVLNDKTYAENMKKYSAVFHAFIENQVEKAAYWIEYAIRHNGAHHLRTAGEDLNFFQYFSLDIITFLIFTLSAFILGLVKIGILVAHKIWVSK